MPARTPYLMDLGDNAVVKLQLVKSSISGIAAAIGVTELPASGEVPTDKALVGNGKAAALASGAFPVNVVYYNPVTKKDQTAKVLISPTKAGPNVFDTIKGQKYAGRDIIAVRAPRRRVYTF